MVEGALPNKIHQTRVEIKLEAVDEGVLKGSIIHHSVRQLQPFFMKEVEQQLENDILGYVRDWILGQEMLKNFPAQLVLVP